MRNEPSGKGGFRPGYETKWGRGDGKEVDYETKLGLRQRRRSKRVVLGEGGAAREVVEVFRGEFEVVERCSGMNFGRKEWGWGLAAKGS